MRDYFLTKPVVVRASVGCIVIIPIFAFGGLQNDGWTGLAWVAVYVAAISLLYFLGVIDRSRSRRRRTSANR